mgnify:CR=1 FL=1
MKAVLFANGELTGSERAKSEANRAELLIAADGGAVHMAGLGITPHVVVGDMDSLSEEMVESLTSQGVFFYRHPQRKDATDLELGLLLAVQRGATQVRVFGALGGRWDMSIANILLCTLPAVDKVLVYFIHGKTEICVIRAGAPVSVYGNPGDTFSFMPVAGPATGVTLEGFEYALMHEDLHLGATRGVSNVLKEEKGTIWMDSGLLLCVRIEKAKAGC